MKFGALPTQDALGTILAHSVDLPNGRMRKGKMLSADDLARLSAAGHDDITVAQLAADDLHEDAAATELAKAFVPTSNGLRLTTATTGRVNVIATAPGVFCCDPAAINAVNGGDPMITIATLPQYKRVMTGDMVATIKIISYAVPQSAMTQAVAQAQPLKLETASHRQATLIETQIGNATPTSKGRVAMTTRIERLGGQLTKRVVVDHTEEALSKAIIAAEGSLIMILTGSATSDAHDVAPQAVRQAGGTLTRFGMPVDPGNLLFIGNLNDKPIIGLPGCARSLAMNGADWVVERMICGIDVTSNDIGQMGVGGLLKESPARHHPRATPQK